jgi:hypothetical protein
MSLIIKNDSSKALQADWLEYGAEAFEFWVLDILNPLGVAD